MVRNKIILLPPACVLLSREKQIFWSVLKLVLEGRHAVAIAGFWAELCAKVVGCVGDVAG